MAIDGVGGVIYANQQIPNVASVVNNHNNRLDMQNILAQATLNEKDEKVLEVRPAEESHEVDPDREHENSGAKQENRMARRHASHKDGEDEEEPVQNRLYILDIKV